MSVARVDRPREVVLVERDREMCSQEEIDIHDVRVRNYSRWGGRGRGRRHRDCDSCEESDSDDDSCGERRQLREFKSGRFGVINLISTGATTPPTIGSQYGAIWDKVLNVTKTAPGVIAITFNTELVGGVAGLSSSTFPPNYPNPIFSFATITISDEPGIDNVGAQYQISLVAFFRRDRCGRERERGWGRDGRF